MYYVCAAIYVYNVYCIGIYYVVSILRLSVHDESDGLCLRATSFFSILLLLLRLLLVSDGIAGIPPPCRENFDMILVRRFYHTIHRDRQITANSLFIKIIITLYRLETTTDDMR